jgi:ABC-2 type transport system ATP-binding protein
LNAALETSGLTRDFGTFRAVDQLTLHVPAGCFYGFLGPNGAGKSTTMRLILGLDRPTAGRALVNGKQYAEHRYPMHEIGGLLDATAVHPRRSARNHLLAMAATHRMPADRVDEVLNAVGLTDVAGRLAGTFSLGMSQRLGIAGALLGDPHVLMLDEPVNGLDPDGVRWIRTFLREFADQGRTVFVSSHLMSEMEQTADRLVVIGRGKLISDTEMGALLTGSSVRVRGPELARLAAALAGQELHWKSETELIVSGLSAEQVGDIAYQAGVRLHELRPVETSLEQAYMELTAESVEYTEPTR